MSLGETTLSSLGGGCRIENRSAPNPIDVTNKAAKTPNTASRLTRPIRPIRRRCCSNMFELPENNCHSTQITQTSYTEPFSKEGSEEEKLGGDELALRERPVRYLADQ
jgi:hypothetical protein